VTAVASPGLHRHLPSTSDLSINDVFESDFRSGQFWHDNYVCIIKIPCFAIFVNDNQEKVWFVIETSLLLC